MPGPRQPPGREAAAAAGELSPRFAALALLEAALARRSGFEEAAAAPLVQSLDPRDRAFARLLALSTLRLMGPIEARLRDRLRAPPPDRVLNLIRLGAAQILSLGTPPFAAVATSVEMAKASAATRPFQGLVNAVLRGVAADGPLDVPPQTFAPAWLHARWSAAYGAAAADRIASVVPLEPSTDLVFKRPEDAARLAPVLEGEILPGGSVRSRLRGDVAQWPEFDAGAYWVQDAAAAVPARILDVRPGEEVLDLCAAPGGKTLQLAAAGGRVTAVDRSSRRLVRLVQNLERCGLSAEVRACAVQALPDAAQADAVLLDAPCSATGTFRRHPDVLWASRPADIAALARTQAELLDAACRLTRPSGRLVYCVCSLEPEEGEAQIRALLARRDDFELEAAPAGAGGSSPAAARPEGWLRILPDAEEPGGPTDGFFVARLRRIR